MQTSVQTASRSQILPARVAPSEYFHGPQTPPLPDAAVVATVGRGTAPKNMVMFCLSYHWLFMCTFMDTMLQSWVLSGSSGLAVKSLRIGSCSSVRQARTSCSLACACHSNLSKQLPRIRKQTWPLNLSPGVCQWASWTEMPLQALCPDRVRHACEKDQ